MHGWQSSFGRSVFGLGPFGPGSYRRAAIVAAAAVAAVAHAPAARGGVVTHRLGEQDFAHGAGPVLVAAAAAAGANEAYPFDGTVFGDDRTRKFGKLSFTYAFQPPAVPADAALTLGLLGLDSPPGTEATVRVYFDGVEQPNAPFAGASSPLYRSSASVVTVPVSAGLLADGELTVTVKAFRRSPGYPGNAIEADFAELSLGRPGHPAGQPPWRRRARDRRDTRQRRDAGERRGTRQRRPAGERRSAGWWQRTRHLGTASRAAGHQRPGAKPDPDPRRQQRRRYGRRGPRRPAAARRAAPAGRAGRGGRPRGRRGGGASKAAVKPPFLGRSQPRSGGSAIA
jgi:hypothetical protein